MERIFSKYRMATKANHKLGDLSSDEPDLCHVYNEDTENYYGTWITGLGFFDVQFPKLTTRPLNKEEIDYYTGRSAVMGSLQYKPYTKEDFEEKV
jgi:hypothetical protein